MNFWTSLLLFSLTSHADSCVTKYTEILNTPSLSNLKTLLGEAHTAGLINETQGSYIRIDSKDDQLTVALFSSSLFDLLAIKKESALRICEREGRLIFEAFGMNNFMTILPDQILIEKAGPKYQFHLGEMTPVLRRLHTEASRLPASTP